MPRPQKCRRICFTPQFDSFCPEQFKLYTVEHGTVTGSKVVSTNGSSHGSLAVFLVEHNVDTLICGKYRRAVSFTSYFIGSATNKKHASERDWFKPLAIACHRIPEKNGHIKVITSAYATLTCPFSPGMG